MMIAFVRKIGILLISVMMCGPSLYAQRLKYPELSESRVVMVGDSGRWDANKVHTLSVVQANRGGYKYWGYYGLSYYFYYGGGTPSLMKAGLARSNDLVHWHKYKGNPIITEDCRWPTVVLVGPRFYIFYSEYDSATNDSRIVKVTSRDGIHFHGKTVVVPMEKGMQNQNPFIFFDRRNRNFYLVYYHGRERSRDSTKNHWEIMLRKSRDIRNLKHAKPEILLSSSHTLAAPSIALYKGKYYLLVEARNPAEWGTRWVTLAYVSRRAGRGYKELVNSPVLSNDDACAFQYVFHNELYVFYSHSLNLIKDHWELKMAKATR